jgi:hypothetical protein
MALSTDHMELAAALTVVEWRHLFAASLRSEAKQVAAEESADGAVRVEHVRLALPAALNAMLSTHANRQRGHATSDDQEAA